MTDTLSDITAEMEAEDNDPVPDAYAKGYADGYKAKALAAGKAQPSEISVHPALATAAEILANFKTEGNKLEEWQACYAKLFTQMNDICNQKRELVEDDNYQGAMAEIYEIVRVARDNPTGLKEFLMINFPEEWGLSKMQHKQLLSGASLSEIEGGKP